MPKFNEWFLGKKGKSKKLPLVDENQQQLLDLINQGLTSGEGALGELFGGFDKEGFEKGITQPALKDFQERILPLLQEKYVANNQALGSGLQRAKLKAGTDLSSKLAELMYQAQQQQKQNQITGLQTGLGKQTVENIYKPGTKGVLQGLLESAAGSVGAIATGASGGGAPAPTPGAGNAAFAAKSAHIAG